jgi:cysteine-rich repeat protein
MRRRRPALTAAQWPWPAFVAASVTVLGWVLIGAGIIYLGVTHVPPVAPPPPPPTYFDYCVCTRTCDTTLGDDCGGYPYRLTCTDVRNGSAGQYSLDAARHRDSCAQACPCDVDACLLAHAPVLVCTAPVVIHTDQLFRVNCTQTTDTDSDDDVTITGNFQTGAAPVLFEDGLGSYVYPHAGLQTYVITATDQCNAIAYYTDSVEIFTGDLCFDHIDDEPPIYPNGLIDCEDPYCADKNTSCYTGPVGTFGVGACHGGLVFCEVGMPTGCIGEVVPTAEVCNYIDDDCDGLVDESFPSLGMNCSAGVGWCVRNGSYVCTNDTMGVTCNVVPGPPEAETCNYIDDNCDGIVDNGFDLSNDSQNCGACNNTCPPDVLCVNGSCGACAVRANQTATAGTYTFGVPQDVANASVVWAVGAGGGCGTNTGIGVYVMYGGGGGGGAGLAGVALQAYAGLFLTCVVPPGGTSGTNASSLVLRFAANATSIFTIPGGSSGHNAVEPNAGNGGAGGSASGGAGGIFGGAGAGHGGVGAYYGGGGGGAGGVRCVGPCPATPVDAQNGAEAPTPPGLPMYFGGFVTGAVVGGGGSSIAGDGRPNALAYAGSGCGGGTASGASGNAGGISLQMCTRCGNGVIDTIYEQCDDGNAVDGDGCTAICTLG